MKTFKQLSEQLGKGTEVKPVNDHHVIQKWLNHNYPMLSMKVVRSVPGHFDLMITDESGDEPLGYFRTNGKTYRWYSVRSNLKTSPQLDTIPNVKMFIKKQLAPSLGEE